MAKAYKVLFNGASFHGGTMIWSQPEQQEDGSWTPGDWMSVDGELELCLNALHLTDQPSGWWMDGAVAFRVEYDEAYGVVGAFSHSFESKIGVRRCRLLRPVDWAEVGVFNSGAHRVTSGTVRATGTASVVIDGNVKIRAVDSTVVTIMGGIVSVEAYGRASIHVIGEAEVQATISDSVIIAMGCANKSSRVWAFDRATVEGVDRGQVDAFDRATVWTNGAKIVARGNSIVRAYGKAVVDATGHVRVFASDHAKVKADGSVIVEASEYASVEATDNVIVRASEYWGGDAELSECAVLIQPGARVNTNSYNNHASDLITVRSAKSSALLRGGKP